MNRAVTAAALLLLAVGACGRKNTSMSHSSVTTEPKATRHSNRLAQEKSPYLLQHQHNPVDWFPWGAAAFDKAKRESKPIFLSIGYSTCHWCHVMERESFENEETARFLNEHFVSIKVDREERPDVDKIYMTFVQAMTGSGGWPLNVFITPDRQPFFGGTYWPPDNRHGRPAFLQVLQQVASTWQTRSNEIAQTAGKIQEQLADITARPESTNQLALGAAMLQNAGLRLKQGYDEVNGGFGSAPKFPSPSHPRFLLRYGARFKDRDAVRMVLHSCDAMAAGGIYDQIGGGFARYSVDARWLVPHFEKMLYDNAQLVQLYLDAYLISGEQRHADVVRDVLRYVLRDMTHPEGGFYSAEDADSEGKEGKFYAWTAAEMKALLSPEEFTMATNYFGVTDQGNFVDHSDPEPLPNQNVLSIANPCAAHGKEALLDSVRNKMFNARAKRVRPHLDDKILASWNGLMLGAVARAGIILGEDAYLDAAERNVAFLKGKLWDARTGTLFHRWRDGQRDNTELLEGYSFLLDGVLDLYEATLDPAHLEFAVSLAEAMISRFYDANNGGFWQSTTAATDLIIRIKDDYDGAEPSGNAVAVMSLLRAAAITERVEFKEAAEKTIRLFSDRLQQLPQAVAFMLSAADFASEEPRRAVIAGDRHSPEAKALLRAAHNVYQPRKVVLGTAGPVEKFAQALKPKDGKPSAYVCTGTACQAPTHEPAKLKALLE
jgi:uncharacterized protein YyaL (SSP411 family)